MSGFESSFERALQAAGGRPPRPRRPKLPSVRLELVERGSVHRPPTFRFIIESHGKVFRSKPAPMTASGKKAELAGMREALGKLLQAQTDKDAVGQIEVVGADNALVIDSTEGNLWLAELGHYPNRASAQEARGELERVVLAARQGTSNILHPL